MIGRELVALAAPCALAAACVLASSVFPKASRAARPAGKEKPAAEKFAGAEFVPGEVLVKFRDAGSGKRDAAAQVLRAGGREIAATVERFDGSELIDDLRLARVRAEDTLAAVEAFRARPDVVYAEPNYRRRRAAVPNDPMFSEQWALKNTGQNGGPPGADIGADLAWNITTGGGNVVVGVIDDGVTAGHLDLQQNVWRNPGEIEGNGADDDANGFVDDYRGYNFYGNNPLSFADAGHGTHVAGIIGARGDDGVGIAGVSWNVRLMSLKIFGRADEPFTDVKYTLAAYRYAKQMRELWRSSGGAKGANLRVVNNSYGGYGKSEAELEAVRALNDAGILFVAAAGNHFHNNDLLPFYPANYDSPNVISVGLSGNGDGYAALSNRGARTVHLSAPGTFILSTVPSGWEKLTGTSMAAPHVAGAAALLADHRPDAPVRALRGALLFSGDPVSHHAGLTLTERRLNAYGALRAISEGDTTPPAAVDDLRVTRQRGRAVTLAWRAPGDDARTGSASLYEVRFSPAAVETEAQFAAARPLAGAPAPLPAGSWQGATVNVPYQSKAGYVVVRALDNLGNPGAFASVAVAVAPEAADLYEVTLGDPAPLSTGGTSVFGGDDNLRDGLPLPFSFPFYGHWVDHVDLSTNGVMYFPVPPALQEPPLIGNPFRVRGLADAYNTTEALDAYRMIAGLWDDLDGAVYEVRPGDDRVVYRWEAVSFGDRPAPAGGTRGRLPVRFEIELRRDGTIQFRYGESNPQMTPLVGISGGDAAAYLVASHSTGQASNVARDLTNARTVTFRPRRAPAPPSSDLRLGVLGQGFQSESPGGSIGDPVAVEPGDKYFFGIGVDTLGPDHAENVVVTAQLPPHLSFVSCGEPAHGSCEGPPAGTRGGVVTARFPRLGDQHWRDTLSFAFSTQVAADTPPGTVVSLDVRAAGARPDPDASNNALAPGFVVARKAALDGVKSIAANARASYALRSDGTVWSWGELFDDSPHWDKVAPKQIEGFGRVRSISAGGYHVAALRADGSVWAMGRSSDTFLGPFGAQQTPVRLRGVEGVTALASGDFFTLGLRADGTVVTWRYTTAANDEPPFDRPAVFVVPGLSNVRAIFAGGGSAFAVKHDGTLWAWGTNFFGQLGLDTTDSDVHVPRQVPGLSNVTDAHAATNLSVVLAGGVAYASGDFNGGSRTFRPVPNLNGIIDAGCGNHGWFAALRADGTAASWGRPMGTQLAPVADVSGATQLAVGWNHGVALLGDGTVRAWGDNSFGQLGDNSTAGKFAQAVSVKTWRVVSPPLVGPAGGDYPTPVTATITSGTPGATLRYTTDGSDPTESSPAVASGSTVSVTRDTLLKVRGFLPGWTPSRIATHRYTVAAALAPVGASVQFAAQRFRAGEGAQVALVTVTRAGDTSAAASVGYRTVDDAAAVPCADRAAAAGRAFARCDYATTIDTLRFAPGEASKTFAVPVVDDGHAEFDEAVELLLTDAAGAALGSPARAALVIADDDAAADPNPVGRAPFFVRQHYLDFLSREPDDAGLAAWLDVLARCPDVDNTDQNSPSAGCDRLLVSQSFFGSHEFSLKALYAYFFYRVAFDRRPAYDEITPDMRSLAGATPDEVFARRAQYAVTLAQRPEFARLYGAMTNQQYVDALLGRHGLQQVTTEDPQDFEGTSQVTLTRQRLVAALDSNTLTRAQVLRAVVQSSEVDAAEYHGAFVSMQYYGYLRRTPEQSGYEAWLRVIRQDPQNVRQMVNGFLNSQEYRLRFGPP